MSRPWMPLYIADYLRDTRKLTAAEHGAYLLLIMEYWTSGGLPNDDRQLARIAVMTASEWRKARPNVEPFFADGWKHKRIDVELARSADISSKRSASAKLKHSNSSAIAQQMDTHAGATSQSQLQPQEKKDFRTVAKATRSEEDFEAFWKAYPRRYGANPKTPAAKLFFAAVKSGVSAENIVRGAALCAAAESQKVGTEFIPQAVKWLRDRRWDDYLSADIARANVDQTEKIDWDSVLTSYKKFGHWSKWAGPDLSSPACLCPVEMLEKYGLAVPLLRAMQ